MSNNTVVGDLREKQLKLDLQKGQLLGFAENDVRFQEDVIIVKDISNGCDFNEDIVIAYSESDNFVFIYQGIYTANKIIGVREVKLFDDAVKKALTKPKDLESFYSLDSAVKLNRVKKYMEDSVVRDVELVFFAGLVRSI